MSLSTVVPPGHGVRHLDGSSLFRISATPGESDEADLVAADLVGRHAAVERLAGHLGGFRVDAVDSHADSATLAVFEVDQDFILSLGVPAMLDKDLSTSDLPNSRLRLADGRLPSPIPTDIGVVETPTTSGYPHTVEPFALWREISAGTTVVLNNVASRVTGEILPFMNDLTRATSAKTQLNAYISERVARGFGLHWDDHDVIVIQCEGRKHWEVFEPAALSPALGYVDTKQFGRSIFSAVLEPGMGLFIPRGWGHQVRGFNDQISVHFTCGLRRMSGLDLLRGLVDMDDQGSQTALGKDGTLELAGHAALNSSPTTVEQVYGRWRSGLRPLRDLGPLAIRDAIQDHFEGWRIVLPGVGGLVFVDSEQIGEHEIGLSASGTVFALDRSWVALYAALLASESLSIREVRTLAPTDEQDRIASWLIELGLRNLLLFERWDGRST